MKKRAKILVSIATCFLCLSFLIVGVYAASRVNFSLNTTLNFEVRGVYVGVSAQAYSGKDVEDEDEPLFTPLNSHHSYTMAERVNFDFVQDSTTTPDFTKASKSTIKSWTPTNIIATLANNYVQYAVTFKNYSNYAIKVTPTNNTTGVNAESMEMIESTVSGNSFQIAQGGTTTYTLTFKVLNNDNVINQTVDVEFAIEKA